MESLFSFFKLIIVTATILTALLLILLSLPASRLRYFTLTIYSRTLLVIAALSTLYIISPLDLIPDIIPILGQVDDAAALVTAIFSGTMGWLVHIVKEHKQPELGN